MAEQFLVPCQLELFMYPIPKKNPKSVADLRGSVHELVLGESDSWQIYMEIFTRSRFSVKDVVSFPHKNLCFFDFCQLTVYFGV